MQRLPKHYQIYEKFLTGVSHIKNDKNNDQHKNPYDTFATVMVHLSYEIKRPCT